jgi:hypothetical protein
MLADEEKQIQDRSDDDIIKSNPLRIGIIKPKHNFRPIS